MCIRLWRNAYRVPRNASNALRATRYVLFSRLGQFIPISAMVMFTTVVFLVAVLNIYKVSRAKLKVQNLADAAALNIASQMASSMNKVSDLNEWMNHMIAQGPNAQPSKPGDVPNCYGINPDLPPLACAENPTKSDKLNMFSLKGNAAGYAKLVQMVNDSQKLFIDAYNNFIGAGGASNSSISTKSSLQSILVSDIPELGDAGTTVFVWNYEGGKVGPKSVQAALAQTKGSKSSFLNTAGMQPLKFKVNDITVTFKTVIPILNTPGPSIAMSLGQLLANNNQAVTPVGWMVPDQNEPSIDVGSKSAVKSHIGAGASVTRVVHVPILGDIPVTAQAEAYIVEGSGTMGATTDMVPDPLTGIMRPIFKPTYWVKLSGVK